MFNTLYYLLHGLYGQNLDNYLYDNSCYIAYGLIMLSVAVAAALFFYYLLKPVRKATIKWHIAMGVAAMINWVVAAISSYTPIRNNVVDGSEVWTIFNSIQFGFADALLACVFFFIASVVCKHWSSCSHVPFK